MADRIAIAPGGGVPPRSVDMTAAAPGLDSYVRRVVDAAPPLNPAQVARLSVLLSPDPGESERKAS